MINKLNIAIFYFYLQSREEDINRDGSNDVLHLQVDMPLYDLEEVIGVQLLIIFDYRLHVSSTLVTSHYRNSSKGVCLFMDQFKFISPSYNECVSVYTILLFVVYKHAIMP